MGREDAAKILNNIPLDLFEKVHALAHHLQRGKMSRHLGEKLKNLNPRQANSLLKSALP